MICNRLTSRLYPLHHGCWWCHTSRRGWDEAHQHARHLEQVPDRWRQIAFSASTSSPDLWMIQWWWRSRCQKRRAASLRRIVRIQNSVLGGLRAELAITWVDNRVGSWRRGAQVNTRSAGDGSTPFGQSTCVRVKSQGLTAWGEPYRHAWWPILTNGFPIIHH